MRQRLITAAVAAGVALVVATPARAAVTPLPDCLEPTGTAGIYNVYYGYVNDGANVSIPFGDDNQVVPGIGYQGQPTVFDAGSYPRVFRAVFNSNAFMAIAWVLDGSTGSAALTTPLCAAGATGPASDLAPNGATIHGFVDSKNVATHYEFDYGTSIAYGQTTAEKVITSSSGALVEEALTGLAPATAYHYRLVTSGSITTVGDDHTFTTPAQPVAPVDLVLAQALTPSSVQPGQRVTSTLSATNAGATGATGVKIVDALPAGATFDAAASSASCSIAAATVTCGVGDLAAGATTGVTVAFEPTVAGTASNVAVVSGDQPDPAAQNNAASADANVTIPPANATQTPSSPVEPIPSVADIGVRRSGARTARKGKRASIVLTVVNRGPVAATGVALVERLPSGLKLVSAKWSGGSCTGRTKITCKAAAIPSGGSVKATIKVLAKKTGKLADIASVSSAIADNDALDNLVIGALRVR